MSHGHSHAHKTADSHADIWTKLNTTARFISLSTSLAYWIGSLVDLTNNQPRNYLKLSLNGMIIGAALSATVSVGTTYALYRLNKNNQSDHYTSISTNEPDGKKVDNKNLSYSEKLAVTGQFMGEACQFTVALGLIFTYVLKDQLPIWAQLTGQAGLFLLGSLVGAAPARTSANSIKAQANLNTYDEEQDELTNANEEEPKADCLTLCNTHLELVANFIATTYWVGNVIDIDSSLTRLPYVNLSWPALIASAITAALSSTGGFITHNSLHISHQSDSPSSHATKPNLSVWQSVTKKFALAGDWFVHTGEIAVPLSLMIRHILTDKITLLPQLLIQTGLLIACGLSAYSDVRTCSQHLR